MQKRSVFIFRFTICQNFFEIGVVLRKLSKKRRCFAFRDQAKRNACVSSLALMGFLCSLPHAERSCLLFRSVPLLAVFCCHLVETVLVAIESEFVSLTVIFAACFLLSFFFEVIIFWPISCCLSHKQSFLIILLSAFQNFFKKYFFFHLIRVQLSSRYLHMNAESVGKRQDFCKHSCFNLMSLCS